MLATCRAAAQQWQNAVHKYADPWTAWAVSLLTPGAGHLVQLRTAGIAWLAADAAVLSLAQMLGGPHDRWTQAAQLLVWMAMGLASGEQARLAWTARLAPNACRHTRACVRGRRRGRALAIDLVLEVPLPHHQVWPLVAD